MKAGKSMTRVPRVGLDLAKRVFVLYAVDAREHCVAGKKPRGQELLHHFALLQPCLIGREDDSGAHYWARELRQLDHDALIMDPKLVARYRTHAAGKGPFQQLV